MSADFGFVVHAAKREADKFAIHYLGDGFTHGSFAGSGRTNETEDRLAFFFGLEAADGEEFEHAVFGTLEPVVIAVEHFARAFQVEVVGGVV